MAFIKLIQQTRRSISFKWPTLPPNQLPPEIDPYGFVYMLPEVPPDTEQTNFYLKSKHFPRY